MTDPHALLLPIRAVSAETGVNAVTLRAWERRYKLICPQRTESGHRLYSPRDVERIRRVLELLDRGVSVSQVPSILDAEPPSVVPGKEALGDHSAWDVLLAAVSAAVARFDERELSNLYDEALGTYPIDLVNRRLVLPILRRTGERWANGTGLIAEEHFFQVFVRNKLGARIHHNARRSEGPLLLSACLPGEQHDIGLLFFIVQALDHGMRVVNLGVNMPLEELATVCKRRRFAAIVLVANYGAAAEAFEGGLPSLVTGTDCPVFVGGRQAAEQRALIERAGAVFLGDRLHEGVARLVQALKP